MAHFFFGYVTSIFKILIDAAVHFELGILIRCDIGAKMVSRSGNKYLIYK
jgi:hypothetical protein